MIVPSGNGSFPPVGLNRYVGLVLGPVVAENGLAYTVIRNPPMAWRLESCMAWLLIENVNNNPSSNPSCKDLFCGTHGL